MFTEKEKILAALVKVLVMPREKMNKQSTKRGNIRFSYLAKAKLFDLIFAMCLPPFCLIPFSPLWQEKAFLHAVVVPHSRRWMIR